MRHMASYLLLRAGGNDAPTAADVQKALSVAGIETDSARLAAFLAEVEGKDLAELIDSAKDRLFVGGGGGGAAPAADAGVAAPAAQAEKPKEEEVDPMEGGMDMFGGGGGGGDY
jgi:ribosomal protein L12E/L44/L45/RPP1/RPP2